jgi:formate hydrogenlyase transcriptional activator
MIGAPTAGGRRLMESRDRAKAYSGDPKRDEVGSLRPEGRSDAFGLEPCTRPSFLQTIVGRHGGLRPVLAEVEAVAPTNATVLITGETGTGKEVIARAIHELSPRRSRNLVKVNCAAMPAGLLETELFGHERGAFTGAFTSHVGRFALADRGTLFLDEIGDMPLELQPKLLRVLQEREFEPVGSTRTTRVDVRVVASTNRDLPLLVRDREFREDLYYRLNTFPISLPALRDRQADIPEFVRYFVQQFAHSMDKTVETIPEQTIRSLVAHPWPGNIRQLRNVIERAVILSPDSVLRVALSDLQTNSAPVSNLGSARQSQDQRDIRSILKQIERQQILAALEESRWVVAGSNGAANRLGMKRSTLQARMQKLGIVRSERQIEKIASNSF